MDNLNIAVSVNVFEKLQRLATPLVDDPSSVIERLIEHWEATSPKAPQERHDQVRSPLQLWVSCRGEAFRVGTDLRATYLGFTYLAKVTEQGIEFNGEAYDSPSSAGRAIKRAAGARGRAASTNGWDFWEMLDPEVKRWVSINVLRSGSAT